MRKVKASGAAWTPPQQCPYCLETAVVSWEAATAVVVVTGCACTGSSPLRIPQDLARRRWRQLGCDRGLRRIDGGAAVR